jgi:hypothetical protein
VRALLKRIMTHAGLGHLDFDLDTFSQPEVVHELDERGGARKWGHDGAAAWFAGIGEDGCCHFGVAEERIGEPDVLVAVLCHEIAHAWRAVHALTIEDRDFEERLTDLSTVYLGFGLLTTNGAYRYRTGRRVHGHARDHAMVARARGVPPGAGDELSARGAGEGARSRMARARRLAGQLEANQAAYFAWAYRKLPATHELRSMLGVAVTAA